MTKLANHSDTISTMRAMYYPNPYGGGNSQFPTSFTSSDKNLVSAANTDELTMTVAVMVNFSLGE